MVSSLITVKAALISTGIALVSMFTHFYLPIAVDFSVSRFPTFWSSFLSWLKPPYLFIVVNVIIIIIAASTRYFQSFSDHDREDELYGGEYETQFEPIVSQSPLRRLEVMGVDLDTGFDFVAKIPELERSEVVYEEEDDGVVVEESSGLINGGDEFAVLRSEWNQVPSIIGESENLIPIEKPLASARSGDRKPVKVSPKGKGGIKKKTMRVVKPKRRDTMENAWKIITEEGMSTAPLTSHYRKPDTFGLVTGDVKLKLTKSETFRDVTNYQQSPKMTPPVKMKKEMSPSLEEMNRKFEAFIKKSKEERLESPRLDKNIA